MKLKVKIDSQYFTVEIGNLSERPIVAIVDGETFEVWPESHASPGTTLTAYQKETSSHTPAASPYPTKQGVEPSAQQTAKPDETKTGAAQDSRAPIPGVITAILVQAGMEVTAGQELCKLEAMKMNNSIRTSRPGKVGAIHVSIGQHVKHNDILIEFAR